LPKVVLLEIFTNEDIGTVLTAGRTWPWGVLPSRKRNSVAEMPSFPAEP